MQLQHAILQYLRERVEMKFVIENADYFLIRCLAELT